MITNTQNVSTPAGLQVLATVPLTFGKYSVDFDKIAFYYNGNPVYSWVESVSNGSMNVWLKMPVSIPANTSISINAMPNNKTVFGNNYWGCAPTLTNQYGQYDNGVNVFNNYWNFAGTNLPSNLAVSKSYASYSINNGLTVSASGGSIFVYYNTKLNPASYIIDAYFANGTANNDGHNELIGWGISFSGGTSGWWGWTDGVWVGTTLSGPARFYVGSPNAYVNSNQAIIYPFIASIYWSSSSSVTGWYNYGVQTTNTKNPTVGNASAIIGYISSGGHVTYYWARIRAYPPNGVMPSVTVSY